MPVHKEYVYPDSITAYVEHYWRYMNPDKTVPWFRGVVAYEDDVVLVVEKPDATKLNLGLVDFTPARWSRFSQQYIDPARFTWFLEKLKVVKPSQTAGYTCPVKAEHTLGNCLLAMTGRRRAKGKGEITLHSRTTIWAPTGILDLYLGSLFAQYWSKSTGEPVRLRWVMDQCQVTTWKSLPFLINLAYMERDRLRGEHNNPSIEIDDSRWLFSLQNGHQTANRYVENMRKVYDMARNIHLYIDRTYRLPARQTNRMLAAEKRYQHGAQRQLFPTIETLYDAAAMQHALSTWSTLSDGDDAEDSED